MGKRTAAAGVTAFMPLRCSFRRPFCWPLGRLTLLLLACLLAVASLSIGFLISATVKRGATAVGMALFLWLLLVFFGDLGLMGTALVLELSVNQLFSLALMNPLQLFKIAAILDLRNNLEVLGPAGIYAFRTYGTQLLPLLIGLLFICFLGPHKVDMIQDVPITLQTLVVMLLPFLLLLLSWLMLLHCGCGCCY